MFSFFFIKRQKGLKQISCLFGRDEITFLLANEKQCNKKDFLEYKIFISYT